MKFFAGLMGVDVGTKDKDTPTTPKPLAPVADMSSTLFKHPKEYAHFSEAQKQELSERMLGVHRQAMRNSPLGKGIF